MKNCKKCFLKPEIFGSKTEDDCKEIFESRASMVLDQIKALGKLIFKIICAIALIAAIFFLWI